MNRRLWAGVRLAGMLLAGGPVLLMLGTGLAGSLAAAAAPVLGALAFWRLRRDMPG